MTELGSTGATLPGNTAIQKTINGTTVFNKENTFIKAILLMDIASVIVKIRPERSARGRPRRLSGKLDAVLR